MRLPGRARTSKAETPEGTRAGLGVKPGKRTRRLLGLMVVVGAVAAFTRPGRTLSRMVARRLDARVEGFAEPESATYAHIIAPALRRFYRTVANEAASEMEARGRLRRPTIVDVGCGTGELVVAISRKLRDARIVGIDTSSSMLLWAGRHETTDGRLRFVSADVARLPFPDESVDMVVSTLSLHHWADPAAAFAEIARVLNAGGVALVYDLRLLSLDEKEMAGAARGAGLEPSNIVRESVGGGLISRFFLRFRLEGAFGDAEF
jgi:SAM-dependent methyltransferase